MSIVDIGGGHGVATLVLPLRHKLTRRGINEKLYTVHGVTDYGGDSRVVREEFGIIPPGDWRRGLESLTRSPKVREESAKRLRRNDGSSVSVGNRMLLAKIMEKGGDVAAALADIKREWQISGHAFPVSLHPSHIKTRLHTGEVYENEVELGERSPDDLRLIRECYLDPPIDIFYWAAKVISEARLAIMGPGSFFTSTITNALVKGFNEALAKSKKFVFILNLVTDPETRTWEAHHFVRQLIRYTGRVPDVIICNTRTKFPAGVLEKYYAERSFLVPVDIDKLKLAAGSHPMRIIVEELATVTDGKIRHSSRLADIVLTL